MVGSMICDLILNDAPLLATSSSSSVQAIIGNNVGKICRSIDRGPGVVKRGLNCSGAAELGQGVNGYLFVHACNRPLTSYQLISQKNRMAQGSCTTRKADSSFSRHHQSPLNIETSR